MMLIEIHLCLTVCNLPFSVFQSAMEDCAKVSKNKVSVVQM